VLTISIWYVCKGSPVFKKGARPAVLEGRIRDDFEYELIETYFRAMTSLSLSWCKKTPIDVYSRQTQISHVLLLPHHIIISWMPPYPNCPASCSPLCAQRQICARVPPVWRSSSTVRGLGWTTWYSLVWNGQGSLDVLVLACWLKRIQAIAVV
jgi:hypothetical protein